MASEGKYRRRVPFTLNTEADILDEFKVCCRKQGQSVSEQFTKFMIEELEKNAIVQGNPIKIQSGRESERDKHDCSKSALEYYIEKRFITNDQWREEFKQENDIDKMEKLEALTSVMHNQARNRVYYLKTGFIRA